MGSKEFSRLVLSGDTLCSSKDDVNGKVIVFSTGSIVHVIQIPFGLGKHASPASSRGLTLALDSLSSPWYAGPRLSRRLSIAQI